MFNNAIPFKEYQRIINAFNNRIQLMFTPLKGRLCMDAPWDGSKCSFIKVNILPDDTGYFECAIEEFYSSWYQHTYDDFDESVKNVKEEFKVFLGKVPDVPDEFFQAGEEAMVQDICRKFAYMCAAGGFAENFDALNGKGLRDKAYTWTSSVFLILAHEYLL